MAIHVSTRVGTLGTGTGIDSMRARVFNTGTEYRSRYCDTRVACYGMEASMDAMATVYRLEYTCTTPYGWVPVLYKGYDGLPVRKMSNHGNGLLAVWINESSYQYQYAGKLLNAPTSTLGSSSMVFIVDARSLRSLRL